MKLQEGDYFDVIEMDEYVVKQCELWQRPRKIPSRQPQGAQQ